MKKRILPYAMAICILLPGLLAAQDIDSLLAVLKSHQDEDWMSLFTDEAPSHIVYLQSGFENRTYFAGRDIGTDQYNMYLQAAYEYRGFTAAAGGVIYREFIPHWYATTVSAGYHKAIILPLDVSISYNRSFFHAADDSLMSTFPNAINLSASYSGIHWGASAGYSLLFGTTVASQFSTGLYLDYTLFRWKGGNKCFFEPNISLVFGAEDVAYAQIVGQSTTVTYGTEFGLLNTEIVVPISCFIGNLDATIAYHVNLPHSLDPEITLPITSLFSISMGYLFSFTGK